MGIIEGLLLGALQGLTEFLPVSSSGHLVLAQQLINDFSQPGVSFDVVLHVGTLVAVLAYFRKDILGMIEALIPGREVDDRDIKRRLALLIIIATIPTGIIGVAGKDFFESLFHSVTAVGGALFVTAALLVAADVVARRREGEGKPEPSKPAAFLIGIIQGMAIIPGISRSGSTICAGIFLGLDGERAARFSFLMSLPAIMGALVLSLGDLGQVGAADAGPFVAGFFAAAVVGFGAIWAMLKLVANRRLAVFAPYCVVLGGLALYWGQQA